MKLILASHSPRRFEILQNAGYTFSVEAADINETPNPNEKPVDFAQRMAKEKASVILARQKEIPTVILAADTIVTLDQEILGKPRDDADAFAMLKKLSGKTHMVITGWALTRNDNPEAAWHVTSASTNVTFKSLSDKEIRDYIATGEPHDKAGAYAIQGKAASFVTQTVGDYENVVGLPISGIVKILNNFLKIS